MRRVLLPPSVHPSHPDYTRERYSPAQAALYLNVCTDIVYREAQAGRLSHRRDQAKRRGVVQIRRTSGRLHFSQSDLDQWREARRHGASTAIQTSSRAADAIELPAVLRFR